VDASVAEPLTVRAAPSFALALSGGVDPSAEVLAPLALFIASACSDASLAASVALSTITPLSTGTPVPTGTPLSSQRAALMPDERRRAEPARGSSGNPRTGSLVCAAVFFAEQT